VSSERSERVAAPPVPTRARPAGAGYGLRRYLRQVTAEQRVYWRNGASAFFTSSDTASPATNSSSACRTSSSVQIGQIGRSSPYSACNFMNSASDRSSIRSMFDFLPPSVAMRNFTHQGGGGNVFSTMP